MGETTGISWTSHTFNPWIGCVKVSPGCAHCYAEELVKTKFGKPELWGPTSAGKHRQVTTDANWRKPLAWNAAARDAGKVALVFSGSLCDIFEDHPDANTARPRAWEIIRGTTFLSWQLLTKRPENIARMLPADWGAGYPNVWLGTSIENNDYVSRADILRAIPATVRFVSYEPALGPLDQLDLEGLDWIIYGGESGPGYRQHDLAWPRDMKRRCDDAAVAFFYKQGAAPRTEMFTTLDGKKVQEYPIPRVTCGDSGDPWTCRCEFHVVGRRPKNKRGALNLFG
jgi:protein gp37